MTRREVREVTFKLLFMRDFHKEGEISETVENFMEVNDSLEGDDKQPDMMPAVPEEPFDDADFMYIEWGANDREYVTHKVEDISGMAGQLDMLIDEAAANGGWSCARMNKIDLTLLRLALYEMRIEGLDAGIAINEAVELAKTYGEERSPSFINGILGKLV